MPTLIPKTIHRKLQQKRTSQRRTIARRRTGLESEYSKDGNCLLRAYRGLGFRWPQGIPVDSRTVENRIKRHWEGNLGLIYWVAVKDLNLSYTKVMRDI